MARTKRPTTLDPDAWKKKAQEIQARVAAKDKARAEAKQKETDAKNKARREKIDKATVKTNPDRKVPRTDYIGYTLTGAAEARARQDVEKEEAQQRENLNNARQIIRDRGWNKNPADAGVASYRGIDLRKLAQEEHDDFADAAEYARNLVENHTRSAVEQKALEFNAAEADDMSRRQSKWAVEDSEQMAPKILDFNMEKPGAVDQNEIDSALKASNERFAKKRALIQKGRERAQAFVKEAKNNAVKANPNAILSKDRRDRAITALVKEAESYGYKGSTLADKAGAAYDKALAANGGSSEKARASVRDTLLKNANKKFMAAAGARMNADQKAREDAIRNNPRAAEKRAALKAQWGNPTMSQAQMEAKARWDAKRDIASGTRGNLSAFLQQKAYRASPQYGQDVYGMAQQQGRTLTPGSVGHTYEQNFNHNQRMMEAQARAAEGLASTVDKIPVNGNPTPAQTKAIAQTPLTPIADPDKNFGS